MDGKALKIGWVLLAIWVVSIAVIANSYRSIEATKEQVYELGTSIQELRDAFSFDSPYRENMADSQSLNLQLIYALRLQLDAHYQSSWLLPDINRLLFTTDRFIEQSQVYLDNNLDLLSLVGQIGTMRERYQGQSTEVIYFRLSANVLEAVFGDSASSPQVYRDLDNIYSQSNQLSAKERQDLQQVLAQVSSVLGGYAQGRYIVEKLQTHDVLNQISVLRGEFDQLLIRHVILGVLLTLIVLGGYLSLLRASETRPTILPPQQDDKETKSSTPESEESAVSPSPVANSVVTAPQAPIEPVIEKQTAQAEPVTTITETSESEIDFDKMLESLNNDMESVCMLLEVFIEDHTGDADKIVQLVNESPEEAQRKAHSLKGVGGNLGATKLREAAGKVEVALKDTNNVEASTVEELKVRLDRAIEEARVFLKERNTINS
ncbi:Hpt domain-containing protein [Vibrio europaeus]|uniref:Hpt domain-containing protein n=1 Tax=Vibrio europaeus TaxID=300876 RepID=A0AAE7AWJ3_9VIBR|nr:Hpt domain-containing protein [Vibrio europaeus]MDC5807330.1 Hpt domain-containing protein [Vibrio europaeus]MDC5809925.1 Hpt domain-containing protein [Vibrio europaeus]MDC5827855.1 Hpt domain-containing protein [Vibrio europaeus]MDC5830699.1 Hpt domain-containing protein [Vibrio europaeus]MDC5837555.1 Hpt domain-containing protein [Vibrio europaeus]